MKRIFLSLIGAGLIGATTANAALPVTRYDAYITEVPQLYAAQGWYWGFYFGGNFVHPSVYKTYLENDPNNFAINGTALPRITIDYQGGEYFALATGYRAYGFRSEAEFSYRFNKHSKIQNAYVIHNTLPPNDHLPLNITILPDALKRGDTSLYAIMGNFYYDYYYTSGWMLTFGLGGGYCATSIDASVTSRTGRAIKFNQTSGAFAAQLVLGTAYRWNASLETALTYRLFGHPRNHYDKTFNLDDALAPGWTIRFQSYYVTNTIDLEFRFT